MFRIEMLPAAHGDCLWIEYGSGDTVNRILIDGGPAHTYPTLRERVLHLPPDQRNFDLLIVTHIDADHIEGVIRLLQDAEALGCRFDRIWFNGWEQLNRVKDIAGEDLGAMQGEYLSLLIEDYEKRTGDKVWNRDLPDELAAIDRKADSLPVIPMPGDCKLTLLSPDFKRLLKLKDHWDDELKKEKIESGDRDKLMARLNRNRQLRPLGDVLGEEDDSMEDRYELPQPDDSDVEGGFGDELGGSDDEAGANAEPGGDTSVANGSSIAVLFEYPADKPEITMLLSGDAWAEVLGESIDTLLAGGKKKLTLDGFKIAHHGSIANLTEELLGTIRCKHYLVSTSGARFRHPHRRAIEMLVDEHGAQGKPRLHFNYLTTTTEPWSGDSDEYVAFHPRGISLEL